MKFAYNVYVQNDKIFVGCFNKTYEKCYSGIVLHGTSDAIASKIESVKSMNLEVACIYSDITVSRSEDCLSSLKSYISLCRELSCPFLRIEFANFVTPDADSSMLHRVAEIAFDNGITVLLETHGSHADCIYLNGIISSAKSNGIGALWDAYDGFKDSKQTPEAASIYLGRYTKHVNVKGMYIEDGKLYCCKTGESSVRIKRVLQAMDSVDFRNYVCIEGSDDCTKLFFEEFYEAFGESKYKKTVTDIGSGSIECEKGFRVWEKNVLIDLTFPQVLDRMVREFPNSKAFSCSLSDYTRTYSQFRDDVDAFGKALIALGVKKGDHVAVWASNVPEWFISFWAVTKIGAVLVSVNTAYKRYELDYLLRQSDACTLIMTQGFKDSDYGEIISYLCPELNEKEAWSPLYSLKLPFLRNIITVGFEQKGCLTWEKALEYAKNTPYEVLKARADSVTANDVCNMQYTSGTTGFPKGVMLTHYNVVNNGKNIGDCLDLTNSDRMMIQVPMFHCFGMVLAMTAAVTHGACMSPIPYFSPRTALDCINKERITVFHGVPTMFIALLSHENFASTDFSYMRTGIMAGSPCPAPVMKEVMEKMNMKDICITFGQTEASPGCTMSNTDDSIDVRVNTVGSAMFGVECKIISPDTGDDLPIGKDGEFIARGYNIMKGYYKMPRDTRRTIDKDGWLHTGDLARKDADGNYRITGRIKDMIIRGGENIYPKEIEDFIYRHPKVSDVQVIGVPDSRYGEEIMACIILKPDEVMTEDELKAYVRDNMAKHKVPRYVRFVNNFPMNAAGKILKFKMREEAAKELAEV